MSTFHTLARVKAETGDPEPQRRVDAEADVIACSDAILASCSAEAAQLTGLYGADPTASRSCRRASITRSSRPATAGAHGQRSDSVINPFCCSSAGSNRSRGSTSRSARSPSSAMPDATLLVVGGASGADGDEEVARIHDLVKELDVVDQVRFVPPQPHHLLSTYYRAADVCLVPSRSESFGLVALESTACGTPVVAAAVGGLRTLVEHGRTGFLVESRDPGDFAAATESHPRRTPSWRARSPPPGRRVPATTRGPPPRPASVGSTPTCRRGRWSTATPREVGTPDDESGGLDRRSSTPRERVIDAWLAGELADNPTVAAVDRGEPGQRRWYVRLRGEQKDTFTIWFTLRQRTLHYETYVMPAPEENEERFYEHLLRAQPEAVRRGVRHRRGARRVPGRPVAGRGDRRRRARPDPRLDVRVRGAVLPSGAADRIRITIRWMNDGQALLCHFSTFRSILSAKPGGRPFGEVRTPVRLRVLRTLRAGCHT